MWPFAAALLLSVPPVTFTEHQLDNGLRVIIHEDHSSPMVAVNVTYHVGSKNELPGRTGLAHLFEHLMFEGSKHVGPKFDWYLEGVGAENNGFTTADQTSYYEILPSNQLELALWLESDRLGFLLDQIDQTKLDNQRDIVKNERRWRYDNQPYGSRWEQLVKTAFSASGYSWDTIGSMQDLDAASLTDVQQFFKTWYNPDNATLVIAGDTTPGEALPLVKKYFDDLPKGPHVQRPAIHEPPLKQEIRKTLPANAQLPGVMIAYRAPADGQDDVYPLTMAANILGMGASSRLEQKLVRERQVAQSVEVGVDAMEEAGLFLIWAVASPGHTAAELENALLSEIDALKTHPVSERELQKAKTLMESTTAFARLTLEGKAQQLASLAALRGDPGLINQELPRYYAVQAPDITRVARQYWQPTNRIVFHFLPDAQ